MLIQVQKRYEYIDCMRGLTMLLVVYYHIIGQVLGMVDQSGLSNFCGGFRMPLFFFVSGFLAYTPSPNLGWLQKKMTNRLLNQFLPTLVTGGIYSLLLFGEKFISFITSPSKSGFWFTIVLFEVFCIYSLLAFFMRKASFTPRMCTITYTGIFFGAYVLRYVLAHYGCLTDSIFELFSTSRLLLHGKFFFVGVIAKMYLPQFMKLVENKFTSAIALIMFVLIFIFLKIYPIRELLLGLSGIMMVYNLFYHYKNFFNNETKTGKVLTFVGKNTLQVYFLHYFFLHGLHNIKNLPFIDILRNNWFIEITIVTLLSMAITASCLLTDRCLRSVPIVHALMFGPQLKNKERILPISK